METKQTDSLDSVMHGLDFNNNNVVTKIPEIKEDEIGQVETSSSAVATPEKRLRDIEFTDMFFSEDGEAFIRGQDEGDGPLSQIPAAAIEDLEILHEKVCDIGQNESEFFTDYDGMRFRVSQIVEVNGIWYALRRLKWPLPKLAHLGGIPERVIEYLGYLGKPGKHGLILVAGATSQGKTTTASSLLNEYLSYYGDVAVTLEDPIELPLSGPHGRFGYCFQTSVDNGDFVDAMKKTMRRAPRYIYLGEIRSGNEASVALRAALTGHLVISTIHAGNCIEAIDGMIKYVAATGEPVDLARQNLASGLMGVVHQRLIRKRDSLSGKSVRALKIESLFLGNESGLRAMIRSGKTEQLSTAISVQGRKINMGQPPL